VEGSKKSVATTLPSRSLLLGRSSKYAARRISERISSLERSAIETMLRGAFVLSAFVGIFIGCSLTDKVTKKSCIAQVFPDGLQNKNILPFIIQL
jgi:hypothetical protein